MKQKAVVHFIFFLFLSVLLYGCGGGGGSNSSGGGSTPTRSFTLSYCNVNVMLISKSNPSPITFSWKVKDSYPNKFYYLDIYLSRDNKLDKDDTLLIQYTSNNTEDNATLNPDDSNYQTLLNAYGGKYYLIFDAYVYNEGLRIESIKYLPNFVLKTKWTVMVYMDGDNSLSGQTWDDLDEMEQVGSNGDVNIVVQDDTLYDTAKRYFIKPSEAEFLQDMGELNMADNQTLIDFANWAINNYPADHYLLVLWNHGNGFEPGNAVRSITARDILEDDGAGAPKFMNIPTLGSALDYISNNILHDKIDIVGFDACLMNMLEVAYEIRNDALYMVGSENTEPEDGWPYDLVLNEIVDNPNITPEELSTRIVADYIDSYKGTSSDATQSAVDLSKIGDLAQAVDNLSLVLENSLDDPAITYSLKSDVYNNVQRFDSDSDGYITTTDSYVDLDNLSKTIAQYLPQFKSYTDSIDLAYSKTVVANGCVGGKLTGSTGLSIWYPNDVTLKNFKYHYTPLSFAKNTHWLDFLDKLWR